MKRLVLLLSMVLAGIASADSRAADMVKEFALTDAQGRKHTNAAWQDKKAVVLLFLGLECPVSNGYAPEFRRLAETFGGKGVLFYGIHPDPDVTARAAAGHAAEYRLPFPILLDPTQAAASQAGIKVVPETVVLTPRGQVLYRGRIDDRYTLDGKRREEPRIRNLEEAIKAVLAGKTPPVAQAPASGCPLPEKGQPAKEPR